MKEERKKQTNNQKREKEKMKGRAFENKGEGV